MRSEYFPSEFMGNAFNCMYCGVYAFQRWGDIYFKYTEKDDFRSFPVLKLCTCLRCLKSSIWYDGRMIVPADSPIEPPHPDLPDECRQYYEESRRIFSQSPRAAAALLRLVVEMLCKHLGCTGGDLNKNIAQLVQQGLSPKIQKCLDYCRVIGNNAIHPLRISIEDNPEIAKNLFTAVNFIIEDMIARPKEINAMYEALPDGAKDAIVKRDNNNS